MSNTIALVGLIALAVLNLRTFFDQVYQFKRETKNFRPGLMSLSLIAVICCGLAFYRVEPRINHEKEIAVKEVPVEVEQYQDSTYQMLK